MVLLRGDRGEPGRCRMQLPVLMDLAIVERLSIVQDDQSPLVAWVILRQPARQQIGEQPGLSECRADTGYEHSPPHVGLRIRVHQTGPMSGCLGLLLARSVD